MTGEHDIVFVGLSLSSSWGNGHATTYRALLRGLAGFGRRVLFLERDVPWYAAHRDLPDPDFCTLAFYESVPDLLARFGPALAGAPAVIVGSYVPEGVAVIDALQAMRPGRISFYDIDTPVTLARLERGEEDYLARRQVPGFDLYLSFTGGPVLDRLERDFGARRAAPLYCAVDTALYKPVDGARQWDLGYLGTYSPDRQPALETLLLEPARRRPDLRFVVAGPQYPETIAWPENVERIAHLPPDRHAAFYGAQRFTLNITRKDMVAAGFSPSVRLFEAAACGTPMVSDWWTGLDSFFTPGEAIQVARRPDDVLAALDMPEPAARLQADAARARVLRDHSGGARAEELLSLLDPGVEGHQAAQ